MPGWLNGLFNLKRYSDAADRRRANTAYFVVSITTLLMIVLLIVQLLVPRWGGPSGTAPYLVGFGVLMVLAWISIRRGWLAFARIIIFTVALSSAILPLFATANSLTAILLAHAMVITVATLLTDSRGVLLVSALLMIGQIASIIARAPGLDMINLVPVVEIAVLGVLNYAIAVGWQRSVLEAKEEATSQRLRMIDLSSEVSQRIFQRTNLNVLLSATVEQVRDTFEEIYHAQIFLLDEPQDFAVLRASTGRVGQELLRRGHKLEIGSQSVIGQVTATGRYVLTRDTSRKSAHLRNKLLPDTRTELALPLLTDNQVLGALDVQSTRVDAFQNDDIDVLQTLANQVAIALDNARLFSEQQAAIAENQALARHAQKQLEQIESLNKQLTGQAWRTFLAEEDSAVGLTVNFDNGEEVAVADMTATLADAQRSGTMVFGAKEDKRIIAVPLTIRGQNIGAMEFELDSSGALDAEQTALLHDVANRLALSLESARLYDEAQRLASREALINELGAKLQGATGTESAIIMAAQGLQTALKAPRIAIRLGTPPQPSPDHHNGQEVDA